MKRQTILLVSGLCGVALLLAAKRTDAQSNYEPYQVQTLAGLAGFSGAADGANSAARFYLPEDVAVDSLGNVYVGDGSHTIRKITPTGVVTTVAGSPGAYGFADGVGSAARFYHPRSIAVDGVGNIYVADLLNNAIRKITPEGVVTTLAGNGNEGSADGTGSAARFLWPYGVAWTAQAMSMWGTAGTTPFARLRLAAS